MTNEQMPKVARRAAAGLLLCASVMVCPPAVALNLVGDLLRVPLDYPTIGAAIEAAESGDEIRVSWQDGGYNERLTVNSRQIRSLKIVGERDAERPVITASDSLHGVIELINYANLPFEFVLENLAIDGGEGARYGVKLFNSRAPNRDEVYNTITIRDCTISHAGYGIEIGERSGTYGCTGQWGAADRTKLGHGRSQIEISGCVVYENLRDGMNLYRIGGELVNCLVINNGDEGCHTTDARDLLIRHNVFDMNPSNNLHLQLCDRGVVRNNLFARSQLTPLGRWGFGVLVGGSFSDDPALVENNLMISNAGSGVRVQATEVRIDSLTCYPVAGKAEIRNNLIYANGWAYSDSAGMNYQVHLERRDLPGMRMLCEYNLFRHYTQLVWGIPLDDSNLRGAEPAYVDEPDTTEYQDVSTLDGAWEVIDGYELRWESPAVDAGDPLYVYRDSGGLSKGTSRNDMGLFGGPWARWPFLQTGGHTWKSGLAEPAGEESGPIADPR